MSANNNNKNLLKIICKANVVCGCGKPKLSDVYEPPPKPKKIPISSNRRPRHSSSSSSGEKKNCAISAVMDNEDYTSTTLSLNADTSTQNSESETDNPKTMKVLSQCPKIVDSIAVVKDSNDPYQDFRHSISQMIMEKEIYTKDDLKELLNCFLELNSPCHHDIILQAFTEIWNDAIFRRSTNSQKLCCVHDGGDDKIRHMNPRLS